MSELFEWKGFAVQTARILAQSVEYHIATLEDMESKKKTSQRELQRQLDICSKLVWHCWDLGIEPYGLMGRECTRLRDWINKQNQVHEDLEEYRKNKKEVG